MHTCKRWGTFYCSGIAPAIFLISFLLVSHIKHRANRKHRNPSTVCLSVRSVCLFFEEKLRVDNTENKGNGFYIQLKSAKIKFKRRFTETSVLKTGTKII